MNRKLRLVGAYVKGLPIWCSWQVTPRCSSYCVFCEHRAEGAFEEADLPTIERISKELATAGALMVSLSGGDPFLREDLPEIVAQVARHHFPLVTTHGWLVTPEKARRLWASGLEAAIVTLDHAEAERQDAQVGQPGAHARALSALRAFAGTRSRASQQVNVMVRLGREALAGLEAVLRLAGEFGATVSVEPGFPLPADLPPGPSVTARLKDLRSRHANLRTSGFFLDRFETALGAGVPGCQAARSFLNIDHRGRVSKCLEFRGPEDIAGDLSRESLLEVLPRLRRVHETNACRACWMSSRGEVEGLYTVRGLLQALPAWVRA